MLGLCFRTRALSSRGKRGPLFITVRGPPSIVASLVAEHRLQTHRLSSCGSRAQLLRGMWDPPRPGLEPASPALAGRFSTTVPPGKPCMFLYFTIFFDTCWNDMQTFKSLYSVKIHEIKPEVVNDNWPLFSWEGREGKLRCMIQCVIFKLRKLGKHLCTLGWFSQYK